MSVLFYLTPKELEILPFIAEAKSNQEIAEVQFTSVRTVESHISSILRKTNCLNRTQLIVLIFTARHKFVLQEKLTKKRMITELWSKDKSLRPSTIAIQTQSNFDYVSSVINELKASLLSY